MPVSFNIERSHGDSITQRTQKHRKHRKRVNKWSERTSAASMFFQLPPLTRSHLPPVMSWLFVFYFIVWTKWNISKNSSIIFSACAVVDGLVWSLTVDAGTAGEGNLVVCKRDPFLRWLQTLWSILWAKKVVRWRVPSWLRLVGLQDAESDIGLAWRILIWKGSCRAQIWRPYWCSPGFSFQAHLS